MSGAIYEIIPEHREDVQLLAENGLTCDEYVEMVRFLRSGEDAKKMAAGAHDPRRPDLNGCDGDGGGVSV